MLKSVMGVKVIKRFLKDNPLSKIKIIVAITKKKKKRKKKIKVV